MQKTIIELWNNETLPIKDGIYFSDGTSLSLSIACAPAPSIKKGDWFDVSEFHENHKDDLANIDTTKEVQLSNGGFVCVGGGGFGSEGFISHLDSQKKLIWVVYAEYSNPFTHVFECRNGTVIVDSSADFKLKIDVNDPANLSIYQPK